MRMKIKFEENEKRLNLSFGEYQNLSDGGFERGYTAGYEKGENDGYYKGHTDGQTDGLESLFLKTIKSFSSTETVSVEAFTFFNCVELEELNLPNLASAPNGMCQNCVKLKKIVLPDLTGSIGTSAFHSCKGLEYADIGAAKSIGAAGFYQCTLLTTLIIRAATVAPMVNSNAIYGTRIADRAGYIYVPKALIEEYKEATNWATYANQFRAIEDYPDICG